MVIQGLTTVITLAALAWVLLTATSERTKAREDSCNLLKGIVLTATPHARRAQVQSFIAHTTLANCHQYANQP